MKAGSERMSAWKSLLGDPEVSGLVLVLGLCE
jgi:hypothetical protein